VFWQRQNVILQSHNNAVTNPSKLTNVRHLIAVLWGTNIKRQAVNSTLREGNIPNLICALLGLHASWNVSPLPTFRNNLLTPIYKGQTVKVFLNNGSTVPCGWNIAFSLHNNRIQIKIMWPLLNSWEWRQNTPLSRTRSPALNKCCRWHCATSWANFSTVSQYFERYGICCWQQVLIGLCQLDFISFGQKLKATVGRYMKTRRSCTAFIHIC